MLANLYVVKKVKLVNSEKRLWEVLRSEQQEKVILMKLVFIKRILSVVTTSNFRKSITI